MRQGAILEAVALGVAVWVLVNRESFPALALAMQRAAYIACQQAARALGMLAIELEKSYRVKVAP
jgi:hypothetical protein